jgi:hypothetical protein
MTQILTCQKWIPVARNDIVGELNLCHSRGTYLIYGIILRDLGIHLGIIDVRMSKPRSGS